MSQIQLHVYPRGYMGRMLTIEPKRDKLRSQIVYNSVVYDARIFHADSDTVMFDHEVEEIFAQYVGKTPESVTANFHERVLCKAMTMFGMSNLCQWLLIHKELKSLTPTHIAFMEDTLKFIFEGKERKMLVQMWERVLTLGAVVEPKELKSWDDLDRYVRNMRGNPVQCGYHYDTKTLVSEWTHKSFADMIYTLRVLFGKFE